MYSCVNDQCQTQQLPIDNTRWRSGRSGQVWHENDCSVYRGTGSKHCGYNYSQQMMVQEQGSVSMVQYGNRDIRSVSYGHTDISVPNLPYVSKHQQHYQQHYQQQQQHYQQQHYQQQQQHYQQHGFTTTQPSSRISYDTQGNEKPTGYYSPQYGSNAGYNYKTEPAQQKRSVNKNTKRVLKAKVSSSRTKRKTLSLTPSSPVKNHQRSTNDVMMHDAIYYRQMAYPSQMYHHTTSQIQQTWMSADGSTTAGATSVQGNNNQMYNNYTNTRPVVYPDYNQQDVRYATSLATSLPVCCGVKRKYDDISEDEDEDDEDLSQQVALRAATKHGHQHWCGRHIHMNDDMMMKCAYKKTQWSTDNVAEVMPSLIPLTGLPPSNYQQKQHVDNNIPVISPQQPQSNTTDNINIVTEQDGYHNQTCVVRRERNRFNSKRVLFEQTVGKNRITECEALLADVNKYITMIDCLLFIFDGCSETEQVYKMVNIHAATMGLLWSNYNERLDDCQSLGYVSDISVQFMTVFLKIVVACHAELTQFYLTSDKYLNQTQIEQQKKSSIYFSHVRLFIAVPQWCSETQTFYSETQPANVKDKTIDDEIPEVTLKESPVKVITPPSMNRDGKCRDDVILTDTTTTRHTSLESSPGQQNTMPRIAEVDVTPLQQANNDDTKVTKGCDVNTRNSSTPCLINQTSVSDQLPPPSCDVSVNINDVSAVTVSDGDNVVQQYGGVVGGVDGSVDGGVDGSVVSGVVSGGSESQTGLVYVMKCFSAWERNNDVIPSKEMIQSLAQQSRINERIVRRLYSARVVQRLCTSRLKDR